MASMLKIIFGTRPEWIKLEPVVNRLKIPFEVICTGQHTDLLEGMPPMRIDHNLEIKSDGNVFANLGRILAGCSFHLGNWGDVVLVQGDTISAFAGALAAKQAGARLIHLEAGIRSGCLHDPWPEEQIRRGISEMADLHLAPTQHCLENLVAEGINTREIVLTGNTIVTSVYGEMFKWDQEQWAKRKTDTPYAIVTMHRREFYQAPDFEEKLSELFSMIEDLKIKVVWPVHPAVTQVVMASDKPDNLKFVGSMRRDYFLRLLSKASEVITDSGGVTEEATQLGIPVTVIREHNDRPEMIDGKQAFGTLEAASKVVEAITAFMEDKDGM